MLSDDADTRAVDPWVWRRAIRAHAPPHAGFRLTLLMISTYMDRRGVGWPSQAALAVACCCAIRTIRRHIERARGQGWLTVRQARLEDLLPETRRVRGQWRIHVYQASVPAGIDPDDVETEIASAIEAESDFDAPDDADTPPLDADAIAASPARRSTS